MKYLRGTYNDGADVDFVIDNGSGRIQRFAVNLHDPDDCDITRYGRHLERKRRERKIVADELKKLYHEE